MAAERKLIALCPSERKADTIVDLQRDSLIYVPEERRAEPQKALEKARDAQGEEAWKADRLEAKVAVDEILIRGYQAREQLRDGIRLFGILLGGLLVLLLVIIPFIYIILLIFKVNLFYDPDLKSIRAIWIGALFGGIGACVGGLMNFTVHRIARGEYEPASSTAIRPLIGSASGILAAVLVTAGILSFKAAELPGFAIVAFLLGFSERLVMGTVERLSTRAEARVSSTS